MSFHTSRYRVTAALKQHSSVGEELQGLFHVKASVGDCNPYAGRALQPAYACPYVHVLV